MEFNHTREPWNKGKLIGQKPPLKPKDIWALRIHLQKERQVRDLALFNLAIDSKLRGCDLVNLHVRDVTHGDQILPRALVVQRKTQQPVQFELIEPTRSAVSTWCSLSDTPEINSRRSNFAKASRDFFHIDSFNLFSLLCAKGCGLFLGFECLFATGRVA